MNIDPRFGFAWRTGLSNLVVRGGYGIFHNSEAQRVFQAMTAGPFVATETFDNGISAGAPLFAWPQAFPSGGSARPLGIQDLNATAVNFRNSYVQQWNLTLEKQLGANGLRLSYIASSAIRLPFRRNINQPRASTTPFNQNLRPYPVVRNIIFADSGGTQSYESFQAEFTRRLNTGIALDSNYTWSKNLTDVRETNVLGDIILDAYNRRAERGNAEFSPRHRWVTNVMWELPVGTGRRYLTNANGFVQATLGGWTLNNFVIIGSGEWNSPTYSSGSDSSNTNVTAGRPDRICDGKTSNPTTDAWFNTSCFVAPPKGIGRFGNSSNGIVAGPSQSGWGLRVFKYFSLTERLKLRWDTQFDNVLNHFVFGNPNVNVSSSSVGRISGGPGNNLPGVLSGSRQIRGGLKLQF